MADEADDEPDTIHSMSRSAPLVTPTTVCGSLRPYSRVRSELSVAVLPRFKRHAMISRMSGTLSNVAAVVAGSVEVENEVVDW